MWLSLFNDQTEKLLGGITADQLHLLKEQGDESSFGQAFTDALFKTYLMKVRVKVTIRQTYNTTQHTTLSIYTHILLFSYVP